MDNEQQNPELSMSLYELNKSMFQNAANMDWRKLENVIKKWDPQGEYFLLYGKESSYFTLFKKSDNTTEKFHQVIKDCLIGFGDLKAADVTEAGDGIEFWVRQKENDKITCLYLFNYDMGVVEFNA